MEGSEQFILRKSEGESLPMVIPVGDLKEAGCFLSCTCLISKSEKAAQLTGKENSSSDFRKESQVHC